jgi:hypothetical protein
VAVFDIGGGQRHALFLRNLVERGVVALFDGTATPERSQPIDATAGAAEAVRRLL